MCSKGGYERQLLLRLVSPWASKIRNIEDSQVAALVVGSEGPTGQMLSARAASLWNKPLFLTINLDDSRGP